MVLRAQMPEELAQPLEEALRVLLPQQVVQEDAHRVHADAFGHAEFLVVQRRIPGLGLEHLQLIDRVRGDVVRADQPRLLRYQAFARSGVQRAPACAKVRQDCRSKAASRRMRFIVRPWYLYRALHVGNRKAPMRVL